MQNNRDYLGAITLYDIIGIGGASTVYLCEYLYSVFAYKKLGSTSFVNFANDKLKRVSEYYGDNECLFPYKFIYKLPTDENFRGYILDYLYNYEKLSNYNDLSLEEKISLLRRSRDILSNFHSRYNCIHTDICPWNYLYNKDSDDLKLIDFDTNIDLKNKDVKDIKYYSNYASEYLKNVGADKDLDIFLHNITVFSYINNVPFYDVLDCIFDGKYGVFEDNKKVKSIFESYKHLYNNKSLKKEYVIDYI